jgi:hypothetical protein
LTTSSSSSSSSSIVTGAPQGKEEQREEKPDSRVAYAKEKKQKKKKKNKRSDAKYTIEHYLYVYIFWGGGVCLGTGAGWASPPSHNPAASPGPGQERGSEGEFVQLGAGLWKVFFIIFLVEVFGFVRCLVFLWFLLGGGCCLCGLRETREGRGDFPFFFFFFGGCVFVFHRVFIFFILFFVFVFW